MTSIDLEKTEKQIDKYEQRSSAFYSQTKAENNARLDARMAGLTPDQRDQAMLDEIKFIQADLLTRGFRQG